MDYENMELDELKEYAKSIGITFGKIGKEKLIEKIKEKESESEESSTIKSLLEDEDLEENDNDVVNEVVADTSPESLLDSITSAIDELEDSTGGEIETIEDLPLDTNIPVKSITYGGLTYKSRTTNAIFMSILLHLIYYIKTNKKLQTNLYD